MADLSTAGEIGLGFDTARLLPQSDPFNRQMLMSLGTFLELLFMAAAGCGLTALQREGAGFPRPDPAFCRMHRRRLVPPNLNTRPGWSPHGRDAKKHSPRTLIVQEAGFPWPEPGQDLRTLPQGS